MTATPHDFPTEFVPCVTPEPHPAHGHSGLRKGMAVHGRCPGQPAADQIVLAAQRDALLRQARAKVPATRVTPGLHTDVYDEDADGPVID